ncbi:hypothetical protein LUZ60_014334 [Juncus effusus]|nr:hypothetical protein LUZ60_014334 [Juncus effusus]
MHKFIVSHSLHYHNRFSIYSPINRKFSQTNKPPIQKISFFSQKRMSVMVDSLSSESNDPFSKLAPLEAIIFDIDGTLCDSDPFHYYAFREMLMEVGFNNGEPITEEFFSEHISGKHNEELGKFLFPNWDHDKATQFMDDKEVMFRKLIKDQLKPVNGLTNLCKWIEDHNLKRAAVTNAPRANAELMISILGLDGFFEFLVIGSECEKAKPFPDPYLKGLKLLEASPNHTFVFEDSASGIKAGVAAHMVVVGLATRNPENVLKEAGAGLLIQDFEDPKLLAILDELEPSISKKR